MEKQVKKTGSGCSFIFFRWLKNLKDLFGFGNEGGAMDKPREETTQSPNALNFAGEKIGADWDSAFKSMDFWLGKAMAIRANGKQPPDVLLKLVEEARYFSNRYIDFFSKVDLTPGESEEFNRINLKHKALELILEEWDIIRQTLEQRENDRYVKVLEQLDTLALECMQPLFGKDVNVYTHIHKLYDIKRFAFSSTPLISAPYDALHAPESWLAVPHETGHYIFWNGTDSFDEFTQFYRGLQNSVVNAIESAIQGRIEGQFYHRRTQVYQVWLNWLNEIFADVFGTLVAGPAFAWSMQSNLRGHIGVRDLYHSHEELDHPDPFIRPYFHIATLREMAKESESDFAKQLITQASLLERSWKNSWVTEEPEKDRAFEELLAKLPTPDSVGSMKEVLANEVPNVVSVIMDADLGKNLQKNLRQYFKDQELYTAGTHSQALQFVRDIHEGTPVEVFSPLMKCIVAQLAIAAGLEPGKVHHALGFESDEAVPPPNPELDARFDEFIRNVTGGHPEAWRRVLQYSLAEQYFDSPHHHAHKH